MNPLTTYNKMVHEAAVVIAGIGALAVLARTIRAARLRALSRAAL